jgi:hypothetical protein
VLSAVLPLLVVYLSEVAAADYNYQAEQAEPDMVSKEQRISRMLDIYRLDPNTGPTAVADELGVSRTTVYSYLDELATAGRVERNGAGVKVLQRR